ncbi:hypothetical protein [Solibacillus sp. FSL H8-0538]|uniref:hypothetical protein n=1 Tax=Solibacillus sp. FSL H8-0538 TaxID=2921400 RepID=UPI0030F5A78D
MSNQKKQIIVNEIAFWKKNKLLPEHYCDFLLTLYTEGNQDQEEMKGNATQAVKAQENRKSKGRALIFPLVAIILLALLFTVKVVWLVAVIVGVAAFICLMTAFYFAKKNNVLAPVLQLTSALLFLGLSVKVSASYFENNDMVLYGLLALNCAMWLLSGLKMKLVYFTFSGGLGLVVMAGFWFIFGKA